MEDQETGHEREQKNRSQPSVNQAQEGGKRGPLNHAAIGTGHGKKKEL